VETGDGRQRPDLVIRMPGGKNVVIDAKAPLEAYLDALDQPDDGLIAATLAYWDGSTRWVEPPPFLAIAVRAFLDAPGRRERVIAWLDPYLARLLEEALDPASGWFTRGGVGSYDGTRTIDQAAVVQLFALRALA